MIWLVDPECIDGYSISRQILPQSISIQFCPTQTPTPKTVRAGARFVPPGGLSWSVTRKIRLLPASFVPLHPVNTTIRSQMVTLRVPEEKVACHEHIRDIQLILLSTGRELL